MNSIRRYLIVALLAAVTLGNFIAAVYGYRSSMVETEALLDTQLADTASLILTTRTGNQSVSAPPSERLAFQVWTTNGTLLQRSANSGMTPITVFEEGYRDENFEGYRWRVLSRLDSNAGRWVLVGERIDIRIELADKIILSAVLPIIISLPLIAAIVWLVVGNGLSLVGKLARELASKRADDLTRLATVDPPVELAPVVDAINGLLQRLENSIKRERRFSADAAHELRTPISALKVHVHNLRQQSADDNENLLALDQDISRLSHLIEQIMLLYRMAPEHYQASMSEVDLMSLAKSVIAELYLDIDSKNQSIRLTGTPQTIIGDEASLKILLSNLILNASKYSPEGASIKVGIDREELGIWLGVKDNGPGIPLTEIGHVFDRFRRVGGDRHDSDVDGCGLGLSIVKHIASLHQAHINMHNNDSGPGLTVSVFFPSKLRATDSAWET